MASPPSNTGPQSGATPGGGRSGRTTPPLPGPASLGAAYAEAIVRLAGQVVARNQPILSVLAARLARSLAEGGVLHLFGSGHSEMIARELAGRAGSLACVSQLLDPGRGFSENVPGYGTRLAERYDREVGFRRGDALLVVSNSGGTASPVEVALYAKDRGLLVIGLGSAAMARESLAAHPAGLKLPDVVDEMLDNGGIPGDALIVVGEGQRAGPTSTVLGALLLNTLQLEVIEAWTALGHTPPILRSQNLPGGAEHNRQLLERYRGRLHRG